MEERIKKPKLWLPLSLGGLLVTLFPLVLLILVFCATGAGDGSGNGNYTGINPAVPTGLTEMTYFLYYESNSEGYYDATLGDSGHAFGAFQFDNRYELQPFLQYCAEKDPQKYKSLKPYTTCSREILCGNTGLSVAWHQIYAMYPKEFTNLQNEFAKMKNYDPVEAFLKTQGIDLSARPDVVKGLVWSIHNRKGMETTASLSYVLKSGVTNDTSNEEFIAKVCDAFGARGGNIYERYCVDYSSAACGNICEKNMALQILKNRNLIGPEGGSVEVGEAGTVDSAQRMAWLFPEGTPYSESAIQPYLMTLSVPVNDANGGASTISLTCHKKLANELLAVFQEMQMVGFPITQCSCYGYRVMASGTGSLSHHSYGVAIDINWDANPAVYWGYSPDPSSPYYINQTIVGIWKKHGFYWGGDWSSSYYDPMHFTYTNH